MSTKQITARKSQTKPGKAALAATVQRLAAEAMPAAPAAPAAAPQAVALRGGQAITSFKLTGKPYRVAAPHNQQWWQTMVAAVNAGNGQAAVAPLLPSASNTQGVPAAFIGYVIRRGYATAV